MNPLIRSAKLAKQSVILGRARRPGDSATDFEDAVKPDMDAALSTGPQHERQTPDFSAAPENRAAEHAIDLHSSFYAVGITPPGELIAPVSETVSFDEEQRRQRAEELAQLRKGAGGKGRRRG